MIQYLRNRLFERAQRAVDSLGVSGLKGKISDGHHTIDELYEHRNTLFIALCREISNNLAYQTTKQTWRKPIVNGWFIMGINMEEGEQISYHLPDGYWHETDFVDFTEKPIKWDGHDSSDVIKRLKNL